MYVCMISIYNAYIFIDSTYIDILSMFFPSQELTPFFHSPGMVAAQPCAVTSVMTFRTTCPVPEWALPSQALALRSHLL